MQRIQVQRLLIAALVALVGCSPEKTPVEKTHTKSEFLHDGDLLARTLAFCKDNPAERQALPNCINAGAAAFGKGLLPCFDHGINHACLEQRGYKR